MLKERKFTHSKSLITLTLMFAFLGAMIIVLWRSQDITLYLVSIESVWLRNIFYLTNIVGEPTLHAILAAVVPIFNVRKGIVLSSILAINSIIIVSMKFIASQPRPYSVFSQNNWLDQVNLPETIKILTDNTSFPSYHSAGAFALITLLILAAKRKIAVIILFVIGVLTATGRVHFFQHFFIDIYVGALIGIGIAYFCYSIYKKYYHEKLAGLDCPIWKLKKQEGN